MGEQVPSILEYILGNGKTPVSYFNKYPHYEGFIFRILAVTNGVAPNCAVFIVGVRYNTKLIAVSTHCSYKDDRCF